MARRILTAAFGIPATVLFIVLGDPWLPGALAAVTVVGLLEFYRLAERAGYRPVQDAGIAVGILFIYEASGLFHVGAAQPFPVTPFVLPFLLVYTILRQFRSGRPGQWLVNTAITVLGSLYVGYLFGFVERLRYVAPHQGGSSGSAPAWVQALPALLVVCVVWGADTAAYFVGSAVGRRKLLPLVSPNKSLEGTIAAILAGPAAGLVFAWAARLDLPMAAIVGLVCASASVCGDLWESALKREAGVKDAGTVLPGHGGVLDRFDGLLFAAVVGYAVMLWWPHP